MNILKLSWTPKDKDTDIKKNISDAISSTTCSQRFEVFISSKLAMVIDINVHINYSNAMIIDLIDNGRTAHIERYIRKLIENKCSELGREAKRPRIMKPETIQDMHSWNTFTKCTVDISCNTQADTSDPIPRDPEFQDPQLSQKNCKPPVSEEQLKSTILVEDEIKEVNQLIIIPTVLICCNRFVRGHIR